MGFHSRMDWNRTTRTALVHRKQSLSLTSAVGSMACCAPEGFKFITLEREIPLKRKSRETLRNIHNFDCSQASTRVPVKLCHFTVDASLQSYKTAPVPVTFHMPPHQPLINLVLCLERQHKFHVLINYEKRQLKPMNRINRFFPVPWVPLVMFNAF